MRLTKRNLVLLFGLAGAGCVGRGAGAVDGGSEETGGSSSGDPGDASTSSESGGVETSSSGELDTSSEGSSSGEAIGQCPEGAPMLTLSGKAGVQIWINGMGPFDVIVDTGAPTTVIDPSVSAVIGASPFVVEVAGEELAPTPSFDELPIVQSFPDAVGILGMDLLGTHAIHFDYPRERFWIDNATEGDLLACEHVMGEPTSTELQAFGGYLWVQGAMEGHEGWLLLDTGATLGAIVDTAYDVLPERVALQGFYTEAIIATFWAELTTLGDIAVGGEGVEAVVVRTIPEVDLPLPPDDSVPMLGLLPTPYLRHFLVTVDRTGGVMRIDRAQGDTGVEPPLYFPLGVGTELQTTPPIHVGQVLPGSAAEEAGVQIGDRIIAVGGLSFEQLPPTVRPWALVSTIEGEMTTMILQRAGGEVEVELDTRNLLLPP